MDDSVTTIGEIADIFDGPHATPKKIEVGPYFLSISSLEKGRLDLSKSACLSEADFKKWTKRVSPQKGDLLFSYETRLGEAALMPDGIRACLGRRMGLLRPKRNKVIPEYLLYAYLSPKFQQTIVSNTIRGATVDRIALNEFHNFKIRIPCIEEQAKVANLLQTLDAKIELNNRINAELEAMAKTLYDFWFVQFYFPDKNGKPYKSSGGKMVWNKELKREIPGGWGAMTIADVTSLSRGVTYGKDDVRSKEDVGVTGILRATNITGNQVDLDDLVYIPKGILSENQFINKFESLIVMSSGSKGHIGKNGIYYFDNEAAFGAFCSKLTINAKFIFYVSVFLNSPWFMIYIKNQCLGTNINNLTNDHIKECQLVRPDEKVLAFFEKTMSGIYKKIASNSIENRELKDLRDWLLPMLMNGQVKVS
jgi:type I restriction enzyme S subunit